jgi:hypothetical protein
MSSARRFAKPEVRGANPRESATLIAPVPQQPQGGFRNSSIAPCDGYAVASIAVTMPGAGICRVGKFVVTTGPCVPRLRIREAFPVPGIVLRT